jgi:hypothetical protein
VPSAAILWIVAPVIVVAIFVLAYKIAHRARRSSRSETIAGSDSSLGPSPLVDSVDTGSRARDAGFHNHGDVSSDSSAGDSGSGD